ncbi:MAG TPA: hypothetical protein VIH42_03540 [Thermoguttaceae bacterium]
MSLRRGTSDQSFDDVILSVEVILSVAKDLTAGCHPPSADLPASADQDSMSNVVMGIPSVILSVAKDLTITPKGVK